MKKSDFYFDLPEGLIAQTPLKNRAESRLLVMDKKSGKLLHRKFTDILDYVNEGDCLVINDTKVIPARLFGERESTGAKIEFLLLKRMENNRYEVLVNPGKKARVGDRVSFGDGILKAEILEIIEGGNRIIKFSFDGIFEEILDKLGEMPLPPYIKEKLRDKNRYQTVYAKNEGSAAAPTAGLHFTNELLEKIKSKGADIASLTLHVGLGTFRPVKTENILDHEMHKEYYELNEEAAAKINKARGAGKKIIAVGTTATRTLESVADENGFIKAQSGETGIFIYPGYKFKIVDNMVTNFHLPESTLVMLVSALSSRENILNAYDEAIKEKYRFFSFGDAMLIADL